MMKHLLFLLLLLLSVRSMSQQVYQFTQYQVNRYLLNPAASGVDDHTEIVSGYRQMWLDLEGAPESFYLTANIPINKQKNKTFKNKRARQFYYSNNKYKQHHGIGIMMSKDEFGAFQKTRVQASYAFHLPVTGPYRISFSPRVGWGGTAIDDRKVSLKIQDDPTYQYFLAQGENKNSFDLDLGLWFYSDRLYAGYSMIQLIPNNLTPADVSKDAKMLAHHQLMLGYSYIVYHAKDFDDLESRNIVLHPGAMIRYKAGAPVNVDLSLEVDFEQRLKIGTTWRMNNAMAFWTGVYLGKTAELYYAYDLPTSQLQPYQRGGHEITLKMKLWRNQFSTKF
ncbi:MAG: type IX secretion system membrane protein PorP/SprF [Salibacter sp.]|uniref:PorP/SprF family type IX secretion system membrane protein n=2 Tax=Salibacter sp. TaxID=2010995 RepID=UPI0028704716|nr:type IX secretion system membrane protein PorP/SprF [Salibacter sp.]MDR9398158.1 type IX secretion system membrane protein PorP/SprF [Salibacter sp.]